MDVGGGYGGWTEEVDFVRITIALISVIFVGFVRRQTMLSTLRNSRLKFLFRKNLM